VIGIEAAGIDAGPDHAPPPSMVPRDGEAGDVAQQIGFVAMKWRC
jgi:hypothetical protein